MSKLDKYHEAVKARREAETFLAVVDGTKEAKMAFADFRPALVLQQGPYGSSYQWAPHALASVVQKLAVADARALLERGVERLREAERAAAAEAQVEVAMLLAEVTTCAAQKP